MCLLPHNETRLVRERRHTVRRRKTWVVRSGVFRARWNVPFLLNYLVKKYVVLFCLWHRELDCKMQKPKRFWFDIYRYIDTWLYSYRYISAEGSFSGLWTYKSLVKNTSEMQCNLLRPRKIGNEGILYPQKISNIKTLKSSTMNTKSLFLLLLAVFAVFSGADASCCKTCSKGKACGDGCIAAGNTCHKRHGCACDAECCKRCNPDKSYPCGNGCIALSKECHKDHGCACFRD